MMGFIWYGNHDGPGRWVDYGKDDDNCMVGTVMAGSPMLTQGGKDMHWFIIPTIAIVIIVTMKIHCHFHHHQH